MLDRFRSRITSAHVIAMLALFVALGGTGYAAVKLPKNSVGGSQIKKNAVSSSKVKNGALLAADFKAGQLPAGATGPQGPKGADGKNGTNGTNGTNGADGADGADGTASAFARIDSTGTLIGGADQSEGITQSMIQHTAGASAAEVAGTGVYCIGGLGFDPTSVSVSTDNTDVMPGAPSVTGGSLNFIPSAAIFKGEDLGYCDAAHGQVRVATEQVNNAAAPTLVNHGFFIWLEG
jgi:hypothetical protein